MTSFVVVNQCSDPDLTPDKLAQICAALDVQLNRDVSTYWGGNHRVRGATPDNPPADGEVVALVVDVLPAGDPQAVAYHDWQGTPQIYAARSMCSSLTSGAGSLSQALSHELCETVGDEGCNLWADDGTGTEWAHELCDAVESGWYQFQDNVAVSDFLLPAYFEPGGMRPYSYLEIAGGDGPAAPFSVAPGGYAIKRAAASSESQVTGMMLAPPTVSLTLTVPFGMRAAKKAHWSARTFRRGARVQL